MRAAMSEVLNQYSHLDVNVTVYVKENTEVYVEDNTNFAINMTSITIASYSETSALSGRATLIPTLIKQNNVLSKAAFSILKNTDLRLTQVLEAGDFSTSEINQIQGDGVTFIAARTSIKFKDIDIARQITDYYLNNMLVLPIYLQDKWFEFENVILNVTGIITVETDPMNVKVVNVLIDLYALKEGITLKSQ